MISDIAIALLGFAAIRLSQAKSKTAKKYAPVVGLLSQPFWFYVTWQLGMPGMFILTIGYTYAWCVGINNEWMQQPGSLKHNIQSEYHKVRSWWRFWTR